MVTEYQLVKTFSTVHSNSVNVLVISSDGRYLASASKDGTVATYDLVGGWLFGTPRLVRKYEKMDHPAVSLAWGMDSRQLFVGFKDGQVCAYQRPTHFGVRQFLFFYNFILTRQVTVPHLLSFPSYARHRGGRYLKERDQMYAI